MSDEADDAQGHEAHYARLALATHYANLEHAEQIFIDGKACCVDCDLPILFGRPIKNFAQRYSLCRLPRVMGA